MSLIYVGFSFLVGYFIGLFFEQHYTEAIMFSDNKVAYTNQSSANPADILGDLVKYQSTIPQTDGYTSVLVVGIDTVQSEIKGETVINKNPSYKMGIRNTDTIMQVIYEHATGNVYFISVPRDMGVDVRKECLKFSGSIHWVYDKGENSKCPEKGVGVLKEVVTGITGYDIHYHVFVTFDAFKNIVSIIGEQNDKGQVGIWVDNPEKVHEIYPDGKGNFESVYYAKGRIFLTPDNAFKYVRSRKVTSDFGRARRQQTFVKACAQRLLSSDILLNPNKILELINEYKKQVIASEPKSLQELIELVNLVKNFDTQKTKSIVLDPEFGGHEKFINKQPHGRSGAWYYMVPTAWKECPGDEFCKVKEEIKRVFSESN